MSAGFLRLLRSPVARSGRGRAVRRRCGWKAVRTELCADSLRRSRGRDRETMKSIGEIIMAPAAGRDFGNSRRARSGTRAAAGASTWWPQGEAGPTAPAPCAPLFMGGRGASRGGAPGAPLVRDSRRSMRRGTTKRAEKLRRLVPAARSHSTITCRLSIRPSALRVTTVPYSA